MIYSTMSFHYIFVCFFFQIFVSIILFFLKITSELVQILFFYIYFIFLFTFRIVVHKVKHGIEEVENDVVYEAPTPSQNSNPPLFQ